MFMESVAGSTWCAHRRTLSAWIEAQTNLKPVSELDRQLGLNESVLRTKVMRTDKS